MKKIYFYIGSNNKTKELESEKAEGIISKYFDGFSTMEIIGYWKGNKERTLKVEVISDIGGATVAKIAKELKEELEQESIMVEILESTAIFI